MNTNTPSSPTLSDLLDQFLEAITDPVRANQPQSLADPRLAELLNAKGIALQNALAQRLHDQSERAPEDTGITGKMLRTLTLMERTQTRIAKSQPKCVSTEFSAEREDAHKFLMSELAAGPRPALTLLAAANKLGIARRTLTRAKSDLGVQSHQVQPENAERCWMWSWIPAMTTPATSQ